jgi:predicted nucleotidyltransferase component of viral defense system
VRNTEPAYQKQVRLLVSLLPRIASEPCFALKGGTAINLFLRDLPRLSVDIDLVYLPLEERASSLAGIETALLRIAKRIQKEIGGSQATPIGLSGIGITKLSVRLENANVLIEVTPTMRGAVLMPEVRSVSKAVEEEFGYAEFPLLHPDEIFAGKLCAALSRQHPRDLYDVRMLLRNEGLTDSLKNVFLVYLMASDRPLAELLDPNLNDIRPLYESEFVGMTEEIIPLEELESVRRELITLLHQKLTDDDRKFLLDFKKGAPDWDTFIFPAARDLPAIRWKVHNLDKMSGPKRKEALDKLERTLSQGPRA